MPIARHDRAVFEQRQDHSRSLSFGGGLREPKWQRSAALPLCRSESFDDATSTSTGPWAAQRAMLRGLAPPMVSALPGSCATCPRGAKPRAPRPSLERGQRPSPFVRREPFLRDETCRRRLACHRTRQRLAASMCSSATCSTHDRDESAVRPFGRPTIPILARSSGDANRRCSSGLPFSMVRPRRRATSDTTP